MILKHLISHLLGHMTLDNAMCIEQEQNIEWGQALHWGCCQFHLQGSYNNKENKFQDIPVWVELNFQDISDTVGPSISHKRSDQYGLKYLFHPFWRWRHF